MLAPYARSLARVAAPFVCALPVAAQSTTRASVASAGTQSNLASEYPSLSSDGRYVAFQSAASNLVPADLNGQTDIFVRDQWLNLTSRVSVSSAGVEGSSNSTSPSISGDGRCVAFMSGASNLVAGDQNGSQLDVFVHDRQTALTTLVSVSSSGTAGNAASFQPAISADGRFVAFTSYASSLVSGDTNACADVFLRDRLSSTTVRVSVASSGAEGTDDSTGPSVSSDGRYVAFASDATNLEPGDTNHARDVFVRDTIGGTTERVSVADFGGQVTGQSEFPSISGDGRFIAFMSNAPTLVVGDTNSQRDIFVHDRVLTTTSRVSVGVSGAQANAECYAPRISSNGRFVVFESYATALVPGDTNQADDVFVRDRQVGLTSRVSVSTSGAQAQNDSYSPSITAGGRLIAFYSIAPNLVAGDTNGVFDVFVRDWFQPCYVDSDFDGFGATVLANMGPPMGCDPGSSSNTSDCDDTLAFVHPGASELCNGIDDNCNGPIDEGFIASYCTPGTTVQGCIPMIGFQGAPSSTATSGFTINIGTVPGQRYGTIFFGFSPTAQYWAVGSASYLCMFFPVQRTGVLDSGGTIGSCDGVLSLDWNAWRNANPTGLGSPYTAGQVLYAQGWFRDPGAAKSTNLSDGLRFTLCQ